MSMKKLFFSISLLLMTFGVVGFVLSSSLLFFSTVSRAQVGGCQELVVPFGEAIPSGAFTSREDCEAAGSGGQVITVVGGGYSDWTCTAPEQVEAVFATGADCRCLPNADCAAQGGQICQCQQPAQLQNPISGGALPTEYVYRKLRNWNQTQDCSLACGGTSLVEAFCADGITIAGGRQATCNQSIELLYGTEYAQAVEIAVQQAQAVVAQEPSQNIDSARDIIYQDCLKRTGNNIGICEVQLDVQSGAILKQGAERVIVEATKILRQNLLNQLRSTCRDLSLLAGWDSGDRNACSEQSRELATKVDPSTSEGATVTTEDFEIAAEVFKERQKVVQAVVTEYLSDARNVISLNPIKEQCSNSENKNDPQCEVYLECLENTSTSAEKVLCSSSASEQTAWYQEIRRKIAIDELTSVCGKLRESDFGLPVSIAMSCQSRNRVQSTKDVAEAEDSIARLNGLLSAYEECLRSGESPYNCQARTNRLNFLDSETLAERTADSARRGAVIESRNLRTELATQLCDYEGTQNTQCISGYVRELIVRPQEVFQEKATQILDAQREEAADSISHSIENYCRLLSANSRTHDEVCGGLNQLCSNNCQTTSFDQDKFDQLLALQQDLDEKLTLQAYSQSQATTNSCVLSGFSYHECARGIALNNVGIALGAVTAEELVDGSVLEAIGISARYLCESSELPLPSCVEEERKKLLNAFNSINNETSLLNKFLLAEDYKNQLNTIRSLTNIQSVFGVNSNQFLSDALAWINEYANGSTFDLEPYVEDICRSTTGSVDESSYQSICVNTFGSASDVQTTQLFLSLDAIHSSCVANTSSLNDPSFCLTQTNQALTSYVTANQITLAQALQEHLENSNSNITFAQIYDPTTKDLEGAVTINKNSTLQELMGFPNLQLVLEELSKQESNPALVDQVTIAAREKLYEQYSGGFSANLGTPSQLLVFWTETNEYNTREGVEFEDFIQASYSPEWQYRNYVTNIRPRQEMLIENYRLASLAANAKVPLSPEVVSDIEALCSQYELEGSGQYCNGLTQALRDDYAELGLGNIGAQTGVFSTFSDVTAHNWLNNQARYLNPSFWGEVFSQLQDPVRSEQWRALRDEQLRNHVVVRYCRNEEYAQQNSETCSSATNTQRELREQLKALNHWRLARDAVREDQGMLALYQELDSLDSRIASAEQENQLEVVQDLLEQRKSLEIEISSRTHYDTQYQQNITWKIETADFQLRQLRDAIAFSELDSEKYEAFRAGQREFNNDIWWRRQADAVLTVMELTSNVLAGLVTGTVLQPFDGGTPFIEIAGSTVIGAYYDGIRWLIGTEQTIVSGVAQQSLCSDPGSTSCIDAVEYKQQADSAHAQQSLIRVGINAVSNFGTDALAFGIGQQVGRVIAQSASRTFDTATETIQTGLRNIQVANSSIDIAHQADNAILSGFQTPDFLRRVNPEGNLLHIPNGSKALSYTLNGPNLTVHYELPNGAIMAATISLASDNADGLLRLLQGPPIITAEDLATVLNPDLPAGTIVPPAATQLAEYISKPATHPSNSFAGWDDISGSSISVPENQFIENILHTTNSSNAPISEGSILTQVITESDGSLTTLKYVVLKHVKGDLQVVPTSALPVIINGTAVASNGSSPALVLPTIEEIKKILTENNDSLSEVLNIVSVSSGTGGGSQATTLLYVPSDLSNPTAAALARSLNEDAMSIAAAGGYSSLRPAQMESLLVLTEQVLKGTTSSQGYVEGVQKIFSAGTGAGKSTVLIPYLARKLPELKQNAIIMAPDTNLPELKAQLVKMANGGVFGDARLVEIVRSQYGGYQVVDALQNQAITLADATKLAGEGKLITISGPDTIYVETMRKQLQAGVLDQQQVPFVEFMNALQSNGTHILDEPSKFSANYSMSIGRQAERGLADLRTSDQMVASAGMSEADIVQILEDSTYSLESLERYLPSAFYQKLIGTNARSNSAGSLLSDADHVTLLKAMKDSDNFTLPNALTPLLDHLDLNNADSVTRTLEMINLLKRSTANQEIAQFNVIYDKLLKEIQMRNMVEGVDYVIGSNGLPQIASSFVATGTQFSSLSELYMFYRVAGEKVKSPDLYMSGLRFSPTKVQAHITEFFGTRPVIGFDATPDIPATTFGYGVIGQQTVPVDAVSDKVKKIANNGLTQVDSRENLGQGVVDRILANQDQKNIMLVTGQGSSDPGVIFQRVRQGFAEGSSRNNIATFEMRLQPDGNTWVFEVYNQTGKKIPVPNQVKTPEQFTTWANERLSNWRKSNPDLYAVWAVGQPVGTNPKPASEFLTVDRVIVTMGDPSEEISAAQVDQALGRNRVKNETARPAYEAVYVKPANNSVVLKPEEFILALQNTQKTQIQDRMWSTVLTEFQLQEQRMLNDLLALDDVTKNPQLRARLLEYQQLIRDETMGSVDIPLGVAPENEILSRLQGLQQRLENIKNEFLKSDLKSPDLLEEMLTLSRLENPAQALVQIKDALLIGRGKPEVVPGGLFRYTTDQNDTFLSQVIQRAEEVSLPEVVQGSGLRTGLFDELNGGDVALGSVANASSAPSTLSVPAAASQLNIAQAIQGANNPQSIVFPNVSLATKQVVWELWRDGGNDPFPKYMVELDGWMRRNYNNHHITGQEFVELAGPFWSRYFLREYFEDETILTEQQGFQAPIRGFVERSASISDLATYIQQNPMQAQAFYEELAFLAMQEQIKNLEQTEKPYTNALEKLNSFIQTSRFEQVDLFQAAQSQRDTIALVNVSPEQEKRIRSPDSTSIDSSEVSTMVNLDDNATRLIVQTLQSQSPVTNEVLIASLIQASHGDLNNPADVLAAQTAITKARTTTTQQRFLGVQLVHLNDNEQLAQIQRFVDEYEQPSYLDGIVQVISSEVRNVMSTVTSLVSRIFNPSFKDQFVTLFNIGVENLSPLFKSFKNLALGASGTMVTVAGLALVGGMRIMNSIIGKIKKVEWLEGVKKAGTKILSWISKPFIDFSAMLIDFSGIEKQTPYMVTVSQGIFLLAGFFVLMMSIIVAHFWSLDLTEIVGMFSSFAFFNLLRFISSVVYIHELDRGLITTKINNIKNVDLRKLVKFVLIPAGLAKESTQALTDSFDKNNKHKEFWGTLGLTFQGLNAFPLFRIVAPLLGFLPFIGVFVRLAQQPLRFGPLLIRYAKYDSEDKFSTIIGSFVLEMMFIFCLESAYAILFTLFGPIGWIFMIFSRVSIWGLQKVVSIVASNNNDPLAYRFLTGSLRLKFLGWDSIKKIFNRDTAIQTTQAPTHASVHTQEAADLSTLTTQAITPPAPAEAYLFSLNGIPVYVQQGDMVMIELRDSAGITTADTFNIGLHRTSVSESVNDVLFFTNQTYKKLSCGEGVSATIKVFRGSSQTNSTLIAQQSFTFRKPNDKEAKDQFKNTWPTFYSMRVSPRYKLTPSVKKIAVYIDEHPCEFSKYESESYWEFCYRAERFVDLLIAEMKEKGLENYTSFAIGIEKEGADSQSSIAFPVALSASEIVSVLGQYSPRVFSSQEPVLLKDVNISELTRNAVQNGMTIWDTFFASKHPLLTQISRVFEPINIFLLTTAWNTHRLKPSNFFNEILGRAPKTRAGAQQPLDPVLVSPEGNFGLEVRVNKSEGVAVIVPAVATIVKKLLLDNQALPQNSRLHRRTSFTWLEMTDSGAKIYEISLLTPNGRDLPLDQIEQEIQSAYVGKPQQTISLNQLKALHAAEERGRFSYGNLSPEAMEGFSADLKDLFSELDLVVVELFSTNLIENDRYLIGAKLRLEVPTANANTGAVRIHANHTAHDGSYVLELLNELVTTLSAKNVITLPETNSTTLVVANNNAVELTIPMKEAFKIVKELRALAKTNNQGLLDAISLDTVMQILLAESLGLESMHALESIADTVTPYPVVYPQKPVDSWSSDDWISVLSSISSSRVDARKGGWIGTLATITMKGWLGKVLPMLGQFTFAPQRIALGNRSLTLWSRLPNWSSAFPVKFSTAFAKNYGLIIGVTTNPNAGNVMKVNIQLSPSHPRYAELKVRLKALGEIGAPILQEKFEKIAGGMKSKIVFATATTPAALSPATTTDAPAAATKAPAAATKAPTHPPEPPLDGYGGGGEGSAKLFPISKNAQRFLELIVAIALSTLQKQWHNDLKYSLMTIAKLIVRSDSGLSSSLNSLQPPLQELSRTNTAINLILKLLTNQQLRNEFGSAFPIIQDFLGVMLGRHYEEFANLTRNPTLSSQPTSSQARIRAFAEGLQKVVNLTVGDPTVEKETADNQDLQRNTSRQPKTDQLINAARSFLSTFGSAFPLYSEMPLPLQYAVARRSWSPEMKRKLSLIQLQDLQESFSLENQETLLKLLSVDPTQDRTTLSKEEPASLTQESSLEKVLARLEVASDLILTNPENLSLFKDFMTAVIKQLKPQTVILMPDPSAVDFAKVFSPENDGLPLDFVLLPVKIAPRVLGGELVKETALKQTIQDEFEMLKQVAAIDGSIGFTIACNTASIESILGEAIRRWLGEQGSEAGQGSYQELVDAFNTKAQARIIPTPLVITQKLEMLREQGESGIVLGTIPFMQQFAGQFEIDGLNEHQTKQLQDKIQNIIWMVKKWQGADISTAPNAVKSMDGTVLEREIKTQFQEVIKVLRSVGISNLVLGCTELPVAFEIAKKNWAELSQALDGSLNIKIGDQEKLPIAFIDPADLVKARMTQSPDRQDGEPLTAAMVKPPNVPEKFLQDPNHPPI